MNDFNFHLMVASPRGFCAGVHRAITIVEKALDLYGAPIYVRHQIVHNPHVVKRLENQGAVFVEHLEDIPKGAYVIFSAHGISPQVREEAERLGLKSIDATCPLVTKVHLEAKRYAREGYHIILIGHRNHVEVQGTVGEAPKHMVIVETQKDAEALMFPPDTKLAYITQTTLSIDDTAEIVHTLKTRFPSIKGPAKSDVCYATQNRQNAVKAMAKQADFIFVVGASNSSNTLRLVEVAEQTGIRAKRIESAHEINPEDMKGATKIGVTAGASAPEEIVKEILEKLESFSINATIQEIKIVDENVFFALPKELRPLVTKVAS